MSHGFLPRSQTHVLQLFEASSRLDVEGTQAMDVVYPGELFMGRIVEFCQPISVMYSNVRFWLVYIYIYTPSNTGVSPH